MMHTAKRLALAAIAACVLPIGIAAAKSPHESRAPSEHNIVIGQGVVCDSPKQIKQFAALLQGSDIQEAIKIVNEEADNPIACAPVMAAFIPGKEVEEVDRQGRALTIVEITIVAVPVNGEWHVVSPVKQFAAFPRKGIEI